MREIVFSHRAKLAWIVFFCDIKIWKHLLELFRLSLFGVNISLMILKHLRVYTTKDTLNASSGVPCP